MGNLLLSIESEETSAKIAQTVILDKNKEGQGKAVLATYVNGLGSVRQGRISASTGAEATATLTVASVIEDDTVALAGVTLTAKNVASSQDEFSVEDGEGGALSDTQIATNLAAAINAHTTIGAVLKATSAAAVVTVSSGAGIVANFIPLAQTGGTITLSGATLSGGTSASSVVYNLGIAL